MSKFRNLLKVGLVLALCFGFACVENAMGDNSNSSEWRDAKMKRNDLCEKADETKKSSDRFECEKAKKRVARICDENDDDDWHSKFSFDGQTIWDDNRDDNRWNWDI